MNYALIGRRKVEGQEHISVINPASGKPIGSIPKLSLDDIREAISTAYSVFEEVNRLNLATRSKLLLKAAEIIRSKIEELSTIMTWETGRPIKSSRAEILRTAQIFELVSAEVRHVFMGEYVPLEIYEFPTGNQNRFALTLREPVGVVGTITPFNFPAASFAHKVAPALAVGNTVVHKPTVLAPLTQIKLADILIECGFPPGSINVVTGDSKLIGDELVTNPLVSIISFTGSDRVGLDLASKAMRNGKRVIMELGGSDAQIVLDDANLDAAAEAAVRGRFDYSGQFCNSTKRVIVRDEVWEEFKDKVLDRVSSLKIGDPLNPDTDIGPIISKDAQATMNEFVKDALSVGSKVLFSAKVPDEGFYFPPTVLEATRNSKVLSEEVFGPILPLVRVFSDDEAIDIANSTKYGLDASIFTRDFARAYRMAMKIRAGTVLINDTTRLRWDNLPFGGVKRSGIGREGIRHTMLEMTEEKVLVYNFGESK
jgi:succinyl-CoA reductase